MPASFTRAYRGSPDVVISDEEPFAKVKEERG